MGSFAVCLLLRVEEWGADRIGASHRVNEGREAPCRGSWVRDTATPPGRAAMLAVAPTPPLPPHELLVFILQTALLLLFALSLGRLAVRLRMPMVVGELLAGVLLGPSVLGHVAPSVTHWLVPRQPGQMHLLEAVSQLGVLLLVGITAAQLDSSMVLRRGTTAVRISLAGLLVPLAFGVGLGLVLPDALLSATTDRASFAAFLGIAMSVSAIPVIAKVLTDMHLL